MNNKLLITYCSIIVTRERRDNQLKKSPGVLDTRAFIYSICYLSFAIHSKTECIYAAPQRF
jgi:hypothetical protein